jgi:hypothetical protein
MMDFFSQLMGGFGGMGGDPNGQQPPMQQPGPPMQLPSAAPGGLAGLLGLTGGKNSFAADTLESVGKSLMTSPRNNPLAGMGKAMQGVQQSNAADAQRRTLMQILKNAGFSDEDAMKYSANPVMAQMAMQQRGMKPGG